MALAHLKARRFRNLGDVYVEPGPGVCVLFGSNAQGKTNLIEAVHLLSNLQSFRTRRLRDLIGLGFAEAVVDGELRGDRGTVRLRVRLDLSGRTAQLNEKNPPSASSYLSAFHTVLFSPIDIDLARGSQDLRRRYLDRATFLRDPSHLVRLRDYNRVLRHRNACLRKDGESIAVWDEQLARLGSEVSRARRITMTGLVPVLRRIHGEISGGDEADLTCPPPHGESGDVEADLREELFRGRERDLRLGYTGSGPHRQMVRLLLEGKPAERFASQGQMRTLALSVKLALLVWGQSTLSEPPLFLLDDPGSELDRARLAHLGRFLEGWQGQVIIASTERDSVPIPDPSAARYFRLESGCVIPA
ncbi:MAG: DNA replication/repair protein RecF [Deferrisomatales bacterium]|nr:DNA replication/repair protein RecF [Deferrisomatales bacterium]